MSNYHRQSVIVKEAGHDVQRYNPKLLEKHLKEEGGVLYRNKRMRYWIDKNGNDCYALYARALDIASGNKQASWRWSTDPMDNDVEVAQSLDIKYLEVKGSFDTTRLSPNANYQVSFLVKLDSDTKLKGQNVNVRLALPRWTKQAELKLPDPANKWEDLVVGSFKMTEKDVGKMEFALERDDDKHKKGLVIKGVNIKTIN